MGFRVAKVSRYLSRSKYLARAGKKPLVSPSSAKWISRCMTWHPPRPLNGKCTGYARSQPLSPLSQVSEAWFGDTIRIFRHDKIGTHGTARQSLDLHAGLF